MNPIQFYEFGKSRGAAANTFIGGVSSTLGTAQLLATKLAIDINRISIFSIDGTGIKCRISGDYVLPTNVFADDLSITNFIDLDGLVTSLNGSSCFYMASNFKEGYFKNLSNIQGANQFTLVDMNYLYIPNVLNIGSSSINNGNFNLSNITRIYVNDVLRTSNAGSVEGDISSIISRGATVAYVTNYIKPNSITNLTSGTIYNTAVQLNFTPPTGNTNTIDFYECYVNGIYKNRIRTSGEYITELTASTNYNVTVVAVDVFFNKSIVSDSINVSTNTTPYYQQNNIFSYYKLEDNVSDFKNLNNGTLFNGNYVTGQVGRGVSLNSTNGYISLNSNAVLGGKNAFSISINFKSLNASTTNTLYGSWSTNLKIIIRIFAGNIQFFTFTTAQAGGNLIAFTDTANFHNLICTYDGAIMRGYLDGVLCGTSYIQRGALNTGGEDEAIGKERNNYGNTIIDDVAIFNTVLTLAQAQELNNRLKLGQSLI
jgi:hypothetical protein